MHICEGCGHEFDQPKDLKKSTRFCSQHCRRSYIAKCGVTKRRANGTLQAQLDLARSHISARNRLDTPPGNCRFCGKLCHNQNSLRNHERYCKENPQRQDTALMMWLQQHTPPDTPRVAWNKGLTKETSESVAKHARSLKASIASGKVIPSWRGRKHTPEQKEQVARSLRAYYLAHPESNPWTLPSQYNYAEQVFADAMTQANISFQRQYSIIGYYLDFAFPNIRSYIEIDGERHYTDPRQVRHDKIRTEALANAGWRLICRIRWKVFRKLTPVQKQRFLDCLMIFLQKQLNCHSGVIQ